MSTSRGTDGALGPGTHAIPVAGQRDSLLVVPHAAADDPLQPLPLLVFCHGSGGDAPDGVRLVGAAAQEAGVLLFLPASAGRTWDIVLGSPGPDTVPVDAGVRWVTARCPVVPERVAVGGFSDGGSYALSIGLARGELFEAVLAFSPGFLAPPSRHGSPRVFVSHGTADRVLPVERCGRRVVASLRQSGYEVRYDEFDGAHVVPPDVAHEALTWWLRPSD